MVKRLIQINVTINLFIKCILKIVIVTVILRNKGMAGWEVLKGLYCKDHYKTMLNPPPRGPQLVIITGGLELYLS